MLIAAAAMLCSSWVLGSPGCGGGLLVFADAAEQVCEVGGGEFPVEWLRGLVVAAGEGEQGSRPGAGRPRGEPLFADDAIARLHRVASGLPRALNNAAAAALIAAAAAGKDLVDDACAKKAVAELTRD
jgi:hypothetical protein